MQETRAPGEYHFESKPYILIVEAPFYDDVAKLQMRGVKAVLDKAGAGYDIVQVPGALEIPAAMVYAMRALEFDPVRRRYDGYIGLGCVVKGGTMHDEIVGIESARALQELTIRYAIALGNGILTCNTKEQALERADPMKMDRAGAAAHAVLRMIMLKQDFRLMPKRRWSGKRQ